MFKNMLFVAAASFVSLPSFAMDRNDIRQTIELKDGSTVYIFDDGKMGMEDRLGRARRMTPDQVMTTKDGRQIKMVGDEVIRVDALKPKGR